MKAAIYSRKSKFTETGESIGNQVQLCKEYANNSLKALNITEYLIYEDEGYSGGNTNRPEFKRLIKDAFSREFQVLICYRLDRISRNVADFSNTLKLLQNNNIDFISIREQFDTTSPMGRAMIYIASVFAQLERETIAERIRDNMLELSKTGRWLGGHVPLGYTSEATSYIDENMKEHRLYRLTPLIEEQSIIKTLFEKYLEFHSVSKLEAYTLLKGITTKQGRSLTKANIRLVLCNPVYVKATDDVIEFLNNEGISTFGYPDGEHGLLTYNKSKSQTTRLGKTARVNREKSEWIAAIGSHLGIIESTLWLKVQKQLSKNKHNFPNQGKTNNALLTGILKCALCGGSMQISHGHNNCKTGMKTFYYVCGKKKNTKGLLCNNKNGKVSDIDYALISNLKKLFNDNSRFLEELIKLNKSTELTKSQKYTIQTSIQEKEKQIENLLSNLSKNDDLSNELLSKIREVKSEIASLNIILNEIGREHNSEALNKIDLLKDIPSIIDYLSLKEQKYLIEAVLDTVLWNGSDHTLEIKFLNESK